MLIRLFLVLSFLTFNVFADEVDFSKVDCNSVETRKALIEEYNEILSSYGITVVDSYNQKTIQKGINKLICYGLTNIQMALRSMLFIKHTQIVLVN
ncbi:hypothetical protein [Escherichia coli]|uniref:hypothetical protein n=1 Tax=Escherichia coli TaxID=562 RepID=UPI00201CE5E3|nr:hypothetical protein [Escherichia coli]